MRHTGGVGISPMKMPLAAAIALAAAALIVLISFAPPSTVSEPRANDSPGMDQQVPRWNRQITASSADSATDKATDNSALFGLYEPPAFQVLEFTNPVSLSETWLATYENLHKQAIVGDPAAQYGLYLASSICYSAPRTAEELEARKEKATAPYHDGKGSYVVDSPVFEEVTRDLDTAWEFCRGADPEVVSEYHNWLTSAAESGYLPALLAWGSDFPGDEQRDLDDAEDRRYLEDRFRDRIRYLERAKAAGSIEAIQKLSTIYQMGELNPLSGIERDSVNSFAHMYAYAWFQLQYENNERYFRHFHEMGMRLPPREFRDAVKRGQEILASEQCCITIARN